MKPIARLNSCLVWYMDDEHGLNFTPCYGHHEKTDAILNIWVFNVSLSNCFCNRRKISVDLTFVAKLSLKI